MTLHTTTEKVVARFKSSYKEAYEGILTKALLEHGNPWFEQFLRETIASVAAEVADATVEYIKSKGDKTENPEWNYHSDCEIDCSFWSIYDGELEKARTAYQEKGV